ncbi:hypothetical protein NKG94_21585 [Micromonospora sp. M12]
MGLGYSVTGVFYNKKLAGQIGMTQPPATVAEFEQLLAKAKTGGVQPIMQFNKNTAGINFPHQALQNQFGDPTQVADWIFQKSGATFDTPAALKATQTIQKWAQAGYFTKDANALDYAGMVGSSRRATACSCSTVTGSRPTSTRRCPATSVSSSSPPSLPVESTWRCPPQHLRRLRQGQEPGRRRVLPELGAHQRQGPRDLGDGRRLQPRWPE